MQDIDTNDVICSSEIVLLKTLIEELLEPKIDTETFHVYHVVTLRPALHRKMLSFCFTYK
jgi:hypothetical protein